MKLKRDVVSKEAGQAIAISNGRQNAVEYMFKPDSVTFKKSVKDEHSWDIKIYFDSTDAKDRDRAITMVDVLDKKLRQLAAAREKGKK